MTNEEKTLLLQDLCARLPYGVSIAKGNIIFPMSGINAALGYVELAISERLSIEKARPYLRPMSSITVEEICKIEAIIGNGFEYKKSEFMVCSEDIIKLSFTKIYELMEFLYRRHFDVNCLIQTGLALEAPEGMYND